MGKDTVDSICKHPEDLYAIQISEDYSESKTMEIYESGFSRIPVFSGSSVGILLSKSLLSQRA